MKNFIIGAVAIGALGVALYSVPPIRHEIDQRFARFKAAFAERESDLRSALLAPEEKISAARHAGR